MVRYLYPRDHHAVRTAKADKDIAKRIYFKNTKFPVKIRDIQKIDKRNYIGISVFWLLKQSKITNV